jgi:hypothetical protein
MLSSSAKDPPMSPGPMSAPPKTTLTGLLLLDIVCERWAARQLEREKDHDVPIVYQFLPSVGNLKKLEEKKM